MNFVDLIKLFSFVDVLEIFRMFLEPLAHQPLCVQLEIKVSIQPTHLLFFLIVSFHLQ